MGDEDVAPRPLEIGEAGGAAEPVELVRLDRRASLDEGRDDLAPALVRHAGDGHLGHGRMQRQAALDLDRRDVLAAGDDHVVDATGDEEIAVGVQIPGVARKIPALAQRLGVGVGAAPIALERFVAQEERDDFAFLADGGNIVRRRGAELDHADALIDAGAPRRAGFFRRILVDGEGVDFRRAVMVDEQIGLEGGDEFFQQAVGHRRAGEAELAHGSHIGLGEKLIVNEVVIERRHQIKVGDPLGRDEGERASPPRSAAGRRRRRRSATWRGASARPWCDRAA